MTQEQSTDRAEREQLLHQLSHDVRTPLGVICTGMDALKAVREDADDFNEIYDTILKDGVGPLKAVMARLIEVACPQENENDG